MDYLHLLLTIKLISFLYFYKKENKMDYETYINTKLHSSPVYDKFLHLNKDEYEKVLDYISKNNYVQKGDKFVLVLDKNNLYRSEFLDFITTIPQLGHTYLYTQDTVEFHIYLQRSLSCDNSINERMLKRLGYL